MIFHIQAGAAEAALGHATGGQDIRVPEAANPEEAGCVPFTAHQRVHSHSCLRF